jgi:hypothetical protein
MNRGIIHKLISKAREYLKKVNVPKKKLIKNLGMLSTREK